MKAKLLVFAKAPVAGRVKTRLVPRFGRNGSLAIYQRLLARTLELALSVGVPVELWCAPHAAHPAFWRYRRRGVVLRVQPPGDLGRRMRLALQDALRSAEAALLIGTDCASLSPEQLREALQRLQAGADLVLGPAEDGGYVLVGARRRVPVLPFQAMPWGTGAVLRRTRQRARRLGLALAELAAGYDVDRPADVKRLRQSWRHP